MEKFIKQYGILIIVAVAVYWFFIRKQEDEIVVDDIGDDGESESYFLMKGYHWVHKGGGNYIQVKDKGVGSGGDCCAEPNHCCYNPAGHCTQCVSSSAVGYGKPPRRSRWNKRELRKARRADWKKYR